MICFIKQIIVCQVLKLQNDKIHLFWVLFLKILKFLVTLLLQFLDLDFRCFCQNLFFLIFCLGLNKKQNLRVLFCVSKIFLICLIFFFSNLLYKAVPIGMFKIPLFVSNAYSVKFFVSDLFNFFGARFFSKFYLDFFDWPSKFVFTYFCYNFKCKETVPLFFSSFKISII